MKRVSSQLIFCSPDILLRNSVIETDENNKILRIFSLNDSQVESSHTLFYNGIISSEIISIQLNSKIINYKLLQQQYQYINLTENIPTKPVNPTTKPLLIDVGTNDILKIQKLFSRISPYLEHFTIFEIIASCTYYPTQYLQLSTNLQVNDTTQLFCWQGIDLVSKKIKQQVTIKIV